MNLLSQITTQFATFHAQIMDGDRIPLALAAILLTLVIGLIIGPIAGNANPLLWLIIDKIFGGFGDRLDRTHRAPADLMFRGFIVTAFVLFIALYAGTLAEKIIITNPYYGTLEVVCLSFLITSGAVWFLLLRLYFALEGTVPTEKGYYALSRSTRTNFAISDNLSITRAAMGFSVRSLDKGLVSPVFWYLIAGLPGALIYSCLAALAWRFGKDGFTKGFGTIPLGLEKLMGFIPNLYTGLLIALAGLFTPTAGLTRGVLSFLGHKNRAKYEQGGFPLSALAWSLKVSLGGASQDITGSAIKSVWTGPEGATAKNDYTHLRRTLFIVVIATILFLTTLTSAYWWSGQI